MFVKLLKATVRLALWVGWGLLPLHAATRTHVYLLTGGYTNELGGPALVPNGGYLGGSGYNFLTNQGPSLSAALNPTNYSIELLFYIKDLSSYRKLIDFKNRTSDNGLYSYNGSLVLYPQANGTVSVLHTNGELDHLVITRNGSSQQVLVYANGQKQFEFSDTSQYAVFSSANSVAQFFRDDTQTAGQESSRGFVSRIQIFAGALTPEEVSGLYLAAPPRLLVALDGLNRVSIAWTNLAVGYKPESSFGLGNAALWSAVQERAVTNGLLHTILLTNTAPDLLRYFRLHQTR